MAGTAGVESVEERIRAWAEAFDRPLAGLVRPRETEDSRLDARLLEAMCYSVLSPGKRLRPYLVCRCCSLCGGNEQTAYPIAAAVECIHAFSLVHDDLPAMDDDGLRRGRPTTHVRFGEALAVLAGDALLALAFELIAQHSPDARRAQMLTLELAKAVGPGGMIGGQAADIEGQRSPADRALVDYVHRHKTARLFESSCRVGGVLVDSGPQSDAVARYGLEFGLGFQIMDDILDATSSTERMGKKVGKDVQAGKQTLVRCVGIEASRRAAAAHAERAIEALEPFGDQASDLAELARFALERDR